MQGIECLGKGCFFHWDADEMNMICHETISPDFKAIFLTVFFKPVKILLKVIVIVKDRILIVAPLGDMMRITNGNGSCYSWHVETISHHLYKSIK